MATDPKDRKTRDLLTGIEHGPHSMPLWLRPKKERLTDKGREVEFADPDDQAEAERLSSQRKKSPRLP